MNILDGVHTIFLYLIVTVLKMITSSSCMVGVTIEEEKIMLTTWIVFILFVLELIVTTLHNISTNRYMAGVIIETKEII